MKALPVAALAILAHALFTTPANAASFDCAQAGTEIEHLICGDEALSKLDELLGDRYVRALKKGEDPTAIKAAQRAWLREVRNACADAACLKTTYEARIAELTKIGWMTDETARAICEEVRDVISNGSIVARYRRFQKPGEDDMKAWRAGARQTAPGVRHGSGLDSVISVDYDLDGKVETLGQIHTGGSCTTLEMADIAVGIRAPLPPSADWDELRWLFFGTRAEDFLFVQDEPVIVAGQALVSWLAPDGTKRVLCTIDQAANEKPKRTEKIEGDNTAPCKAVLARSVKFAEWLDTISVSRAAYREQVGRNPEGRESVIVDLTLPGVVMDVDRDGEPDHVAYMEYASGAGCGSDSRWLVEVDPGSHDILDSPITGISLGGMNFSLAGRSGRNLPLALFAFESEPYVLANDTVLAVRGGAIQPQCRITFSYEIMRGVKDLFPVATWPE